MMASYWLRSPKASGDFVEHVHADADLAENFGQRIVVCGDVADVQAGGHDQIEDVDFGVGRLGPVARGQRGNRLERSANSFVAERRKDAADTRPRKLRPAA